MLSFFLSFCIKDRSSEMDQHLEGAGINVKGDL
jgi:hypothetical protein